MRKTQLVILPGAKSITQMGALLLFLACPNIAFVGRDRTDPHPPCPDDTSQLKWLQKKPDSPFNEICYLPENDSRGPDDTLQKWNSLKPMNNGNVGKKEDKSSAELRRTRSLQQPESERLKRNVWVTKEQQETRKLKEHTDIKLSVKKHQETLKRRDNMSYERQFVQDNHEERFRRTGNLDVQVSSRIFYSQQVSYPEMSTTDFRSQDERYVDAAGRLGHDYRSRSETRVMTENLLQFRSSSRLATPQERVTEFSRRRISDMRSLERHDGKDARIEQRLVAGRQKLVTRSYIRHTQEAERDSRLKKRQVRKTGSLERQEYKITHFSDGFERRISDIRLQRRISRDDNGRVPNRSYARLDAERRLADTQSQRINTALAKQRDRNVSSEQCEYQNTRFFERLDSQRRISHWQESGIQDTERRLGTQSNERTNPDKKNSSVRSPERDTRSGEKRVSDNRFSSERRDSAKRSSLERDNRMVRKDPEASLEIMERYARLLEHRFTGRTNSNVASRRQDFQSFGRPTNNLYSFDRDSQLLERREIVRSISDDRLQRTDTHDAKRRAKSLNRRDHGMIFTDLQSQDLENRITKGLVRISRSLDRRNDRTIESIKQRDALRTISDVRSLRRGSDQQIRNERYLERQDSERRISDIRSQKLKNEVEYRVHRPRDTARRTTEIVSQELEKEAASRLIRISDSIKRRNDRSTRSSLDAVRSISDVRSPRQGFLRQVYDKQYVERRDAERRIMNIRSQELENGVAERRFRIVGPLDNDRNSRFIERHDAVRTVSDISNTIRGSGQQIRVNRSLETRIVESQITKSGTQLHEKRGGEKRISRSLEEQNNSVMHYNEQLNTLRLISNIQSQRRGSQRQVRDKRSLERRDAERRISDIRSLEVENGVAEKPVRISRSFGQRYVVRTISVVRSPRWDSRESERRVRRHKIGFEQRHIRDTLRQYVSSESRFIQNFKPKMSYSEERIGETWARNLGSEKPIHVIISLEEHKDKSATDFVRSESRNSNSNERSLKRETKNIERGIRDIISLERRDVRSVRVFKQGDLERKILDLPLQKQNFKNLGHLVRDAGSLEDSLKVVRLVKRRLTGSFRQIYNEESIPLGNRQIFEMLLSDKLSPERHSTRVMQFHERRKVITAKRRFRDIQSLEQRIIKNAKTSAADTRSQTSDTGFSKRHEVENGRGQNRREIRSEKNQMHNIRSVERSFSEINLPVQHSRSKGHSDFSKHADVVAITYYLDRRNSKYPEKRGVNPHINDEIDNTNSERRVRYDRFMGNRDVRTYDMRTSFDRQLSFYLADTIRISGKAVNRFCGFELDVITLTSFVIMLLSMLMPNPPLMSTNMEGNPKKTNNDYTIKNILSSWSHSISSSLQMFVAN